MVSLLRSNMSTIYSEYVNLVCQSAVWPEIGPEKIYLFLPISLSLWYKAFFLLLNNFLGFVYIETVVQDTDNWPIYIHLLSEECQYLQYMQTGVLPVIINYVWHQHAMLFTLFKKWFYTMADVAKLMLVFTHQYTDILHCVDNDRW